MELTAWTWGGFRTGLWKSATGCTSTTWGHIPNAQRLASTAFRTSIGQYTYVASRPRKPFSQMEHNEKQKVAQTMARSARCVGVSEERQKVKIGYIAKLVLWAAADLAPEDTSAVQCAGGIQTRQEKAPIL